MSAFRLQVLPHAERVRKHRLYIGTQLSHRHAGSSSSRALVPEVLVILPGTGEPESDLTDDADENDEDSAKDYKGGVMISSWGLTTVLAVPSQLRVSDDPYSEEHKFCVVTLLISSSYSNYNVPSIVH